MTSRLVTLLPLLNAWLRTPTVFWVMAAMCVAPVGLALVSQHVWGHEPCPWCILQRVVFVAIALVAVAAAFMRSKGLQRAALVVIIGLAMAGCAAALWQHFVAASSQSCNLTLADKIIHGLQLDTVLPEVFEPRASCADAIFHFLGVPYEVWSLMLYGLLAVGAVVAMRKTFGPSTLTAGSA